MGLLDKYLTLKNSLKLNNAVMEGVAKAISSKAEEELKTTCLIKLMKILLKQKLQTRSLIFLPHKSYLKKEILIALCL